MDRIRLHIHHHQRPLTTTTTTNSSDAPQWGPTTHTEVTLYVLLAADSVISQQVDSIVADHRVKRSSYFHHDNDTLDFPHLSLLGPYILPLLKSELRTFKNFRSHSWCLRSTTDNLEGFQDHIKRMYYTPCVISLLTKSISGIIATLYTHVEIPFFDKQIRWNSLHGITWPKV